MEWKTWLFSSIGFLWMGIASYKLYPIFRAMPMGRYFSWILWLKIAATFFMLYLMVIVTGTDLVNYNRALSNLSEFLLEDPSAYFRLLFGNYEGITIDRFIYVNDERAWFFLRFFHWAYFLSGNSLVSSSIFSTLLFLGVSFWMVNKLLTYVSVSPIVLLLSFYGLPSFVFWTTGFWKETISLTALFFVIGYGLSFGSFTLTKKIGLGVIAFLLLLICWKLKFYFLAIFLVFVPSYSLMLYLYDRYKLNLGILMLLFLSSISVLMFLGSQLHYTLHIQYFAKAVWINYFVTLQDSPGKHFVLEAMGPNFLDLIYCIPESLYYGLLSPFPDLMKNPMSLSLGLENVVLCLTMIVSFFKWINNPHSTRQYLQVFIVLCCLLFSISLLTMSSPNPGTLVRYKTIIMPIIGCFVFYALPENWKNWLNHKLLD